MLHSQYIRLQRMYVIQFIQHGTLYDLPSAKQHEIYL